MVLSRLPLPRTKTVLLDRSLDRKGREKHLLHFVAVMKVRTYVCICMLCVCTQVCTYVYEQYMVKTIIIVIMVCVCVYVYLCCLCVGQCVFSPVCCGAYYVRRCSSSLCFPCSTQCLREFNNFNSFLCILSAIESAAVSRLDWSDKVNKVSDPTRNEPAAVLVPLL